MTLITPTPGDNWGVGSTQQITWMHDLGAGTQVRIEVSRNGGTTYTVVAAAVTNSATSGVFNWTVTGPNTTTALIRVSATAGGTFDVSDAPFRIAAPVVHVTAPNGGEAWVSGSTAPVVWTDNLGVSDLVEIRLSTNGGSSYPIVLDQTAADGSHSVGVSASWLTTTAKVRVSWVKNSGVTDRSNGNFKIASPNQPPTVALTAPATGATFTAPATITVSASASDTDGTIARVNFYRGSTLIGSDTTSPYSIAWSNVAAASYSLTAIATDDDGATTTSAARAITVIVPANQPPTVALTAPAAGSSFTAPATITMNAAATDTDGTIAQVDFYQGAALIGSDTTSPYGITWNNVPAGAYSLTAVARDNAGAPTTSAARSVTVTGGLPSGWTGADVGSPAIAGSTAYAPGTFTVRGAGEDIWQASDQFHFAYQQITGDFDIVARVQSVEQASQYSKAGVMIRASLAANSANAGVFPWPAPGY